jgi:hypothetical protein
MKDYPTPKYEQHHEAVWERHKDGRRFLMLGDVVDLLNEQERQLAECREALELVIRRGSAMQNSDQYLFEVLNACQKTLTNTAPKP